MDSPSSLLVDSDAWVTNGIIVEPILLQAVAVDNDGAVMLVLMLLVIGMLH